MKFGGKLSKIKHYLLSNVFWKENLLFFTLNMGLANHKRIFTFLFSINHKTLIKKSLNVTIMQSMGRHMFATYHQGKIMNIHES
jgi:hypothetical protein